MVLDTTEKAEVLKESGLHKTDTDSPGTQVALLTARIRRLTEHLKFHKHDHHSCHGLLLLVDHRKGLLQYLQDSDVKRYRKLVERLGLRR